MSCDSPDRPSEKPCDAEQKTRTESPGSAQLASDSPQMVSMCAVSRLGVRGASAQRCWWTPVTCLWVGDAAASMRVPLRAHQPQKPRRGHTHLTARCACPYRPLAPGAGWICPAVASSLSRSKICVASAERRQNGRAEGSQEGISRDPQRRPPLTSRRALTPIGPGHQERPFGALLTRILPLVQRPFCHAPLKMTRFRV